MFLSTTLGSDFPQSTDGTLSSPNADSGQCACDWMSRVVVPDTYDGVAADPTTPGAVDSSNSDGGGVIFPLSTAASPVPACACSICVGSVCLQYIIGGAVGGVALITAACCCWLRHRRRDSQESHRDVQVRIEHTYIEHSSPLPNFQCQCLRLNKARKCMLAIS